MMLESVLSMRNIEKKYRGFALDIPSLEIPKGFATALIGENGAGKSTLFRILAGTRLDFTGEVEYFSGVQGERVREWIGYTCPSGYFMPHWTIGQVGEAGKLLYDNFDVEEYQRLLRELAVQEPEGKKKKDKSVMKLSDGMQTKVMLASVFARDTRLLLLDEPASPLDPLMRDKLCDMFREYLRRGAGEHSIFFSTHNITDMENVTDYAVILANGRVVEQGFVEDLKERYVAVKGEASDAEKARDVMYSLRQGSMGFEGICRAEKLEGLRDMDVAFERPSLSQICVAVLQRYTSLQS